MKKNILFFVLFAILGLVVGYGLFGKMAGGYIPVKYIFGTPKNELISIGKKLSGLESMKQNILICGGAGGIVGLIVSFFKK